MKRYETDVDGTEFEHEQGTYVKFDDVEPVIADRDVKAANLQLLVEKVLAFGDLPGDARESEFLDLCDEAVELARGLKQ